MKDESSDTTTFEEALVELERIVRTLEDGQTGLEESLSQYEKGVGLLRRCYGQLRQAEQRILVLTGQTEDNGPALKPFEHAPSLDGVVKPRPRLRSED